MRISKNLLEKVARVDLLGGDEGVALIYKNGKQEVIDASTGKASQTGYVVSRRVIDALNKNKLSMTPFNYFTDGMGAAYFGRDGLIRTNMSATRDPSQVEANIQCTSPRGVIVKNPVAYALTLASIMGCHSMEEAAANIDVDVFEKASDYQDVKEAFATFAIEVADDAEVAGAVEAVKILQEKRLNAKANLLAEKNKKEKLERLFRDEDPMLS